MFSLYNSLALTGIHYSWYVKRKISLNNLLKKSFESAAQYRRKQKHRINSSTVMTIWILQQLSPFPYKFAFNFWQLNCQIKICDFEAMLIFAFCCKLKLCKKSFTFFSLVKRILTTANDSFTNWMISDVWLNKKCWQYKYLLVIVQKLMVNSPLKKSLNKISFRNKRISW